MIPTEASPPESRLARLRDEVRAGCENRPGVYRMLGPTGELLYVGKSVRLRTRLLSYFRAKRGEKGAEIVSHAHGVAWDYEPSEFAALLTEMRLIQRHRPLFNVAMKRSRAHCFVRLTGGVAPRLLVTRRVVAGDRSRYYGPFLGIERVRAAVKEVVDLLGLRDCRATMPLHFADQADLFGHRPEPLCSRADLGRCLGPCAGRCGESEYRGRVEEARSFLEGRLDRPLHVLDERMRQASDRLQFEYAAELRDRATRLRELRDELVHLNRRVRELTLVHTEPGRDRGEDRVYVIRSGRIRHECAAPRTGAERERLEAATRRIMDGPDPWRLGVTAHDAAEILLVLRWFERRRRRASLANTRAPASGPSELPLA